MLFLTSAQKEYADETTRHSQKKKQQLMMFYISNFFSIIVADTQLKFPGLIKVNYNYYHLPKQKNGRETLTTWFSSIDTIPF